MVVSVAEKVQKCIKYGSRRRTKVNHRSIVERLKMISKLEGPANPGQVWQEPAYWPDGIRHRGGVSLIRALLLNYGNLSQR